MSRGAPIHRLDLAVVHFRQATHCYIHVSGGEFITDDNLSHCFGLRTGV